jgi:hypothetical protein
LSLIESRTKGKNVYDCYIIPFSLMVMGFRILEAGEADQPAWPLLGFFVRGGWESEGFGYIPEPGGGGGTRDKG